MAIEVVRHCIKTLGGGIWGNGKTAYYLTFQSSIVLIFTENAYSLISKLS